MQGNSVFAIVGDANREVLLCNCHLQVVEPCMNNSLSRRRVVCLGMFVFCFCVFAFVLFWCFLCFCFFSVLLVWLGPTNLTRLASSHHGVKKVVVEVVSSMSVELKEVVRGK